MFLGKQLEDKNKIKYFGVKFIDRNNDTLQKKLESTEKTSQLFYVIVSDRQSTVDYKYVALILGM